MQNRKLGVLLSTPPSSLHVGTVARLCHEAVRAKVDVYLYLVDEGVRNVNDPWLTELSSAGVKCFVCAYGCQRHRVPTDKLAPGVSLCGLVVLANIINGCDRFVAFN